MIMLYTIHDFIENYDFHLLYQALNTTDEDIVIDIDSCGGNLREAWKMYDAIRTHNGKVTVNVSGDCMSAAVLILLAAKPENRFANINAQFMIHKPLLEWWDWTLTDEDCVNVHEEITKETEKLKACYLERTTASETEIDTLINAEQIFGVELAINLGFVSKKNEYVNKKVDTMKRKPSTVEMVLRNVLVKAGLLNQKEYKTADDDTLIVETSEEPKVGDESPNSDGEYLMPDGQKIFIKDGKIEKIEEPAPPAQPVQTTQTTTTEGEDNEGNTETQGEQNELENLRKEVAQLRNKAEQYDRIFALVNKCGGETALTALLNTQSKQPQTKSSETKTGNDDSYNYFKNL